MILTLQTFKLFGRTRLIEAQVQFEAPDPHPLNKWRTDHKIQVIATCDFHAEEVPHKQLHRLWDQPSKAFTSCTYEIYVLYD